MSFKIRNTDCETQEEYEVCQKNYFQHLESFNKRSNTDLWEFFAWDFFHDGTIEKFELGPDLRTLSLHLDCPNIRSYDQSGSYKYVSIDFVCTFKNVIHFSISDSGPTIWSDHLGRSSTFLYSEINTAIPDGLPNDEDSDSPEFYSLIIEILGESKTIWVDLVFSQVNVLPKEPAAFAIMEADPKFHVPTYRPDA